MTRKPLTVVDVTKLTPPELLGLANDGFDVPRVLLESARWLMFMPPADELTARCQQSGKAFSLLQRGSCAQG